MTIDEIRITAVAENYSVAPQVQPGQIAALAEAGFTTLICNRPDDEEPGQPTAAEIAAVCEELGLAFVHIPVVGLPIPTEQIDEHRRVVDDSAGPVLGYCRSGQRSLIIWQVSV